MNDEDLEENEKALIAVQIFFPAAEYRDFTELAGYIPVYINRGQETKKDKSDPVFDLLEDSGRIYVAFLQAYGIDLLTVEMHWWKFLTLLDNLPNNTKLSEVIGIRARTIPKGTNRAQASAIRKLKDIYALGKKKTVGEKLQTAWEMF